MLRSGLLRLPLSVLPLPVLGMMKEASGPMVQKRAERSVAGHSLEGGGLNQSQISGLVYVVICFKLRYASKPASPSSRPNPLFFTPPQGA